MSNKRSRQFTVLAALLVTLATSCDERGSTSTVTPNGTGSDSQLKPQGDFEGESIDELALRLDHLSAQQRAQVTAGNQDPAKCEELCELSQAICEIKTKMCEIADERVADDEYQNLCRGAKQRCQESAQSCVRCVEHHQRAYSPLGPEGEAGSCEGAPGQ